MTLARYYGQDVERPWLRRTVTPQSVAVSPVSIDEFAVFIEEPCTPTGSSTREALWQQFLEQATDLAIAYTDREMLTRTIVTAFDAYGVARAGTGGLAPVASQPSAWLDLPRVAADTITSVTTVDSDGNTETIDPADYEVDLESEPHRIQLDFPPSRYSLADFAGLRVTYDAGYADAGSVPGGLKLAVQQLAAYLYERRGMNAEGSLTASGAAGTLARWRVRTGL